MATGVIGDRTGTGPPRPPRRPQAGPPVRTRPAAPVRTRPAHPHPPGIPHPVPPAPAPSTARGLAARTTSRPRTPFVVLLLALLGGGLVCLLLINTTLAEGSFQITAMQQKNASLSQQAQSLEQQIAALESPASIAARAEKLGMRPVGRLRFLDLKNGRIYSQPATEPGVGKVPGYTP